jgi:hypothetical protein
MPKALLFPGILLLTTLTSCKKGAQEDAPAQDYTFEIKYSSDGMRYVDTQLGLNLKSQTDPTKGGDLLTTQLGHAVDASGQLIGASGQLSTMGKFRKGDQVQLYVTFKDITNPAFSGPAGNGFLAAALAINGNPAGVVRLNYYEYHNSPQLRVVDGSGKTNVLKELIVTIL